MIAFGDNERSRDAERKAAVRAAQRDVEIPAIKDRKRRDACRDDDCLWLRTYLPDVFYYPFTPDQETIIREVGQALRHGTSKCIAAPRGDGKSSITKYLTLKYALYHQIRFGLIVCATGPKAEKTLAAIKARLRAAPGTPLFEDFPLECVLARYVAPAPSKANNATVDGGKRIHMEWKQEHLILPTLADEESIGPIIMAAGVTSDQLQGCNVYDIRPDFVMLDDLDSRESLAAVDGTVAGKIETIIDQNIGGLGGPGRRMGQVMLCTITSRDSVAYKYSDPLQKPAWSGIRMARIRKWPKHRERWNEYIELRQKGQNTRVNPKDLTSPPVDPYGRQAHKFYEDNRAELDEGSELSNPYDYNQDELPDGTKQHLSALQKCFDYIADKGERSFLTEHQNDPPEEEGVERSVLTAYHIQYNCRSGLDHRIIPTEAVCVVAGVDIKKLGFHYVVYAFDAYARGCCVEYNFHELRTENMELQAVELAIQAGLHEWKENRDNEPYYDQDGNERRIDLALIDEGWKHESWAGQPVRRFCAEAGFSRFLPCKGEPNYRTPKPSRFVTVCDNYHLTYDYGIWWVGMNSDHWKQKVHEGFALSMLDEQGEPNPGALVLFEPPSNRRTQPHMSYAKHITSEVWERRFQPGFRGWKEGWWKDGAQNHYFDATYQALVAASLMGPSVLAHLTTQADSAQNPPHVSPPQEFSGGRDRSW